MEATDYLTIKDVIKKDKQLFVDIKQLLIDSIRTKIANKQRESAYMPFHTRLLGKDRMALYSFIHSLNIDFNNSIFVPVAARIGKSKFITSEKQQIAGTKISSEAQIVIQNIMDDICAADICPNRISEVERIRKVCQKGQMNTVKLTKVDLKLQSASGDIYLIDIKSAIPKIGSYELYKRTMLERTAAILADDPTCKIHTMIALPYNPYHPEPYELWIIKGMLDLDEELLVAEGFWDFLGGKGCYEQLLDVFEEVGVELRDEIDAYFAKHVGR
ncbi:MAG: TdeIII family type II restriction endonuclease [Candidatus Cloacimonetes bacterium]|nr:TdeIII family type II restriction endonuclease [Candidatus Cloacimonadota bacterium]